MHFNQLKPAISIPMEIWTSLQPRPIERAEAKDVGAGPVKAMPVANRDSQVLSHRLARDHTIRVVHPVGQVTGLGG